MKKMTLAGAWQFRQVGTQVWNPASVPGGVHTDLLALGKIPDPFVGDNEKRVAWVAQSDWEYIHSFELSPGMLEYEQVWLVCDGLDTLASLVINGHALGQTSNMFRQYRWDVKSLLKAGRNELQVRFDSAVAYASEKQTLRPLAGVSQAIEGGPYVRKAPCQFGWDWGPQLPPVGIWKDIRLEAFNSARLADVHLRQAHVDGKVNLGVSLKVEGNTSGLSASMQVTAPDGAVFTTFTELNDGSSLTLEIKSPELWWPNGLGAQPLYRVRVVLHKAGSELDEKELQIGLRTIELRQQPDAWGRSFTFVVNGLPIFAKGSDWIPADSFPTRISAALLESLIRSAADTHQKP